MQYLAMKSNDIRRNLATEQYLMNSDQMTPPFMLFYIEDSCIIVGRNQNTLEEINQEYCEEHGVTITRRLLRWWSDVSRHGEHVLLLYRPGR